MRELRRRIPVLDRKRGLPFGSRPRGRLTGWAGVVPISLRERIIGILPFSERLYHRFVHSHGAAELPFGGGGLRDHANCDLLAEFPYLGPPHNISVPSHA